MLDANGDFIPILRQRFRLADRLGIRRRTLERDGSAGDVITGRQIRLSTWAGVLIKGAREAGFNR